ncbi:hypothetical protein FACS189438_2830 [Bacteroidia bacterium]|nr:hypothetical protein FACS189438_2830 [Bacteroidia bacterium]
MFFTTFGCGKAELDEEIRSQLKAGVFGGSISVFQESETAKNMWRAKLNINVTSCGVGGAGFSSVTRDNVPFQIERAKIFDVYILWASTNDVVKSTVGNSYEEDERTQDGGILKSIDLIRRKNSKAVILFFTSLPRFDDDDCYEKIPSFVEDQIAICEKYQIPYLDQYRRCAFNKDNYQSYYLEDKIHLSNAGYASIAPMQVEFIREHIKDYVK